MNPALQTDYYKVNHHAMYPPGTTKIYSNLTPRKSRIQGINAVVVFGIQYFILEYLIKQWNEEFFGYNTNWYEDMPARGNIKDYKQQVISKYKRVMDNTLGKDAVSTKHLEDLWDLGYMPLHIKALPEGTLCPIGVPCLTITNTVDHAFWLVNYLETILSCSTWQAITSATIAHEYKKLLLGYAKETGGPSEFVNWQGHDFSMRGMSSLESACISGAGHLLSFTGTDTIPAISFLEQYYGANVEKELVGASVPATEHSVMCMGQQHDEYGTFNRLLEQFPTGIISVVSDTWNLWTVLTDYLPKLKETILKRDGKLVIRPDSGDPVDILCGTNYYDSNAENTPIGKGVIELLWDIFGGKVNEKGYKELDPHIGAIYGDSITLDRAKQICERLKAKGFASTNVVLGIGSFTYQYNTRDTFGFAVKATYGEVNGEGREIFKDPITDDGTKKSKKGLLVVYQYNGVDDKTLYVKDQCSKEEETKGRLETVFLNGKLVKFQTLAEIRQRLNG
jgi:nicotinamide phosphoribosyltransferase